MRLFSFVSFFLLSACIDWNTGPTMPELVDAFLEAKGIEDAENCGEIAPRECAESDDLAEMEGLAVQCFAEALEACTPAILEIVHVDGDGGETYETLVIYPEGESECAVERFVSYPDGGARFVKEESCTGASIPTEACEAPVADSCAEVCDQGGDTDCG